MHKINLLSRSLEKARSHPLNAHCRKVLEQTGHTLGPNALGAPELMQWTLEQDNLHLDPSLKDRLQEVLDLIQDKPSMSLGLLDAPQPGSNDPGLEELLADEDPRKLGVLLLQRLKSRLSHLTARD
ncbi:MAG: hypothetical protein R6U22_04385 [Desulfohalobiaceae bacterium]